MTTTPKPAYPFCVIITKPGHDTVYLGFMHAFQAGDAAASLTGQLSFTAHPEDTTITWAETPPNVEPEPPMPTTPHLLSEEIEKMRSGDGSGSNFPDPYSRLCAQEGHDAAKKIWAAACVVYDEQPEILPENTSDDKQRRELQHQLDMAANAANAVGMPLGMWAGRGDYASMSTDARDKAGGRALSELDTALTELHQVRDRLAAHMGKPPFYDTTVVTVGYEWEHNAWQVEIHQPGTKVEVIPIVFPQTADRDTAQALAQQVAENRGLLYLEDNKGLTPPAKLVRAIREALWMPAEDDPALIAEVSRLRVFEETADMLGWTRVTEPEVTDQVGDAVVYDAKGITVLARAGIVGASIAGASTTGSVTGEPERARAFGAALIVAAKQAEDLQRTQDEHEAAASSLAPGDTRA